MVSCSTRAVGSCDVAALIDQVAEWIDRRAPRAIPRLGAWNGFFRTYVARPLDALDVEDAPPPSAPVPPEPLTEVDGFADQPAVVDVLHRFDEAEMQRIDALIARIPELMRRHPEFRTFEGEEILAAWLTEHGIALPDSVAPSYRRAQGGYIMHMANDARQNAHLHGMRRGDGSWVADSGSRVLVGLIGARRSTIRHPLGVIRVPRGALVRIDFPQTADGPTAHQFWNEDDAPGPGNVLLSFHTVDFPPDGDREALGCASEMMNRRTFTLSHRALASSRHHGFVA
jgi:hypothetical protein